jgi:putative transposase
MPKSYSADLRERVIEAVASGISRHEAAELFGIAVSTAVKWWQHWRETGSTAPKPRGGSTSRLEEHMTLILGLVKEQPDSTFMELLAALRKRRILRLSRAVACLLRVRLGRADYLPGAPMRGRFCSLEHLTKRLNR